MTRITAHPLGSTMTLQQLRICLLQELLLNIERSLDQSTAFIRQNVLPFTLRTAKKMCGKSGQKWRFLLHTQIIASDRVSLTTFISRTATFFVRLLPHVMP